MRMAVSVLICALKCRERDEGCNGHFEPHFTHTYKERYKEIPKFTVI